MSKPLSVAEYFSVALPSVLRAKGREATLLGVNVRFVVTGRGGGTWTVRLRAPHACVVPGGDWKPDLVIKITSAEMSHILAGTFDPARASAAGSVEFSGNVGVLKGLGFLFQRIEQQPRDIHAG